jgi:hypothetical protein
MQRNREIKLALEISSIHQLSQGLSQRKMSKKKKQKKSLTQAYFRTKTRVEWEKMVHPVAAVG